MSEKFFSAPELADSVNQWCDKNKIVPVSGQVGDLLTERNIRYYRSLGLLSAPKGGRGRGFNESHRLQLIAVRLLQAHGLPLRKIQELLFGKSDTDLSELIERSLKDNQEAQSTSEIPVVAPETWLTTPVDEDFLLISRSGKPIDSETLIEIRRLLAGLPASTQTSKEINEK